MPVKIILCVRVWGIVVPFVVCFVLFRGVVLGCFKAYCCCLGFRVRGSGCVCVCAGVCVCVCMYVCMCVCVCVCVFVCVCV